MPLLRLPTVRPKLRASLCTALSTAPALCCCRWEAAVRLLVVLVQEEARLCAAVFPPAEQAPVLQQVRTSLLLHLSNPYRPRIGEAACRTRPPRFVHTPVARPG